MPNIESQKTHNTRSNWTPVDASPYKRVTAHSRGYGTPVSGEGRLFFDWHGCDPRALT